MTKYDHRRGEPAKRPGMCYGYKDPMVKWEVEVRLYRHSTTILGACHLVLDRLDHGFQHGAIHGVKRNNAIVGGNQE